MGVVVESWEVGFVRYFRVSEPLLQVFGHRVVDGEVDKVSVDDDVDGTNDRTETMWSTACAPETTDVLIVSGTSWMSYLI